MVYHCSGACSLDEGTMQAGRSEAKCLRRENPLAAVELLDRLTVASSGSSRIDCKEEPIP